MKDCSRLIAVTNRHFFDAMPDPDAAFLKRTEEVLSLKPCALVLREKDLLPESYRALAERVLRVAEGSSVPVVLHSHPDIALELGVRAVHLPLAILEDTAARLPSVLMAFDQVGASVHSLEEAHRAVSCGASYLFAGNIFKTACKPGRDGRGIPFLRSICNAVPVPVFGIGGVTPENLPGLLNAGAAGGCMMSGFFQTEKEKPERN